MYEWLVVVLLGIIEGVTEFLPISSTAHLLAAGRLIGFTGSQGGAFEIAIQFGAVLAVIGYYARQLTQQVRAFPVDPTTRRVWLGVMLAFLPAALIGLAIRPLIKGVLFQSPLVMASALLLGGLVLLWVERRAAPTPHTLDLRAISPGQALAVGLAQAVALVPGVSRSGAAIVGGLLAGLDRPTAVTFSFYLAIPTLGAATALELVGAARTLTAADFLPFVVGTLVALVASWLSIGWLLRYVTAHSFVPFAIYRVVAGLALALLSLGPWRA